MQRVLIVVILLGSVGAAMLLLGSRWSRHREKWNRVAGLPQGFTVDNVALSDDGVGAIGGYIETRPDAETSEEQIRSEIAAIWRVEGSRVEKVYEATGWITALHGVGPNWYGVASTLKATGSGSNYRLIRSLDRARTWQEAGNIPASSIVQILVAGPSTMYVFGANTLLATTDGGQNWNRLPFPASALSREFAASIALAQDGSLLAYGFGLMRLSSRTGWDWVLSGQYKVEAVTDPYVAAVIDEKAELLRRTSQTASEVSKLPSDRLPVRIAASGETIRILTDPRDPAKLGFFSGGLNRVLLRSDDGGKS